MERGVDLIKRGDLADLKSLLERIAPTLAAPMFKAMRKFVLAGAPEKAETLWMEVIPEHDPVVEIWMRRLRVSFFILTKLTVLLGIVGGVVYLWSVF